MSTNVPISAYEVNSAGALVLTKVIHMARKTAARSEIGARLEEFAVKVYKSISGLARAMEIPKSQLSRYLTGEFGIPSKQLLKLSALGLDTGWLLNGQGRMLLAPKDRFAADLQAHLDEEGIDYEEWQARMKAQEAEPLNVRVDPNSRVRESGEESSLADIEATADEIDRLLQRLRRQIKESKRHG